VDDRVATPLCVLGPLEVVRDDEPVRLGSPQQRRLLAVLVVHANEVVSSDRLVDVLWGEHPPRSATHSLQTLLSRLRATLGDERLEPRPPGYRLRVASGEVDVLRFEELVRVGLESSARPEVALGVFDEALRLWRGSPYAEFASEEFATAEVVRLVELRARAIEERAAALLELGRPEEVIGELEAEIAVEPFRERLRALLMLALTRAGRPVESLRAYDAFRRFLADEVGVVPSPALQALNDDVVHQHPDVSWAGSPAKDAGRPLLPSGTVREFAARTMDGSPGNLPLQSSSFVGREVELVRVTEAVERSRVVTLTGVGGVGKTRLALQVARDVSPRFRDGVWLCELAAVRDPGAVLDAVAAVFRVSARSGLSLEDSLVAYLRDLELLVVLDNCEHLLQGAAGLVVAIEAACRGVRVLATSREGLNIAGEQLLVVPCLSLPDEDGTQPGSECEAVRLFADRAQAVKADFTVDATNRADVVAVCTHLDGVALAIELAAARIPAMNPSELARRLDRRFRLLTGGGRVAIERHQTLRAAIDWSYELLTEPEQRLLARLSVFSGGCTLEAAEAITAVEPIDANEVFELVAGLVARSLVVADTGPETRYRLLETIREYGEEHLAEARETDMLRLRHASYYTELARVAQSHLYGREQVEWGARLARERENLLAAMAFALDTQDADLAFGLFCQFPLFGLQVDDVVVFDPTPLLALPGATEHPGSAVALMAAGYGAWRCGDVQQALRLCDQALAAEQRLGPTVGSRLGIWSSRLRGYVAQSIGTADDAVDYFLDAAARARADDVPALAAFYFGLLAQNLSYTNPIAARQHASIGLALARESGMPLAIGYNLIGLAQAVVDENPNQARALLSEALQLETALGYESHQELQGAVFCAARLDDWPTALGLARRVLHQHSRSGGLPLTYLAGMLNLVARGLAERQPEPAAMLQGTVGTVIRRLTPEVAAPVSGDVAGRNDIANFVATVRRDTTRLLAAALGDTRLRELRAHGATMDETQACTYARTQIDEYFARSALNEDR
jgi:predicted ATPase/DNA-binding SARP family transcriptional activator